MALYSWLFLFHILSFRVLLFFCYFCRVNVRNVNRKRYVHLADGALSTDEDIPWGDDAVLTIVYFPEGKYGIQASNGKYLAASGALKDNADADTRFIIKFHSDQVSFLGNNGRK